MLVSDGLLFLVIFTQCCMVEIHLGKVVIRKSQHIAKENLFRLSLLAIFFRRWSFLKTFSQRHFVVTDPLRPPNGSRLL